MGMRKLTGKAAILAAAICAAAATSAFADGWVSKSISINFAGPRDSSASPGDSGFSAVSGSALFGALPVAGDNWNNFQTHASTYGSGVTSASSIKLGDGTVAAGVSASWNAACTYSVSASSSSDNIFNSFLDGSAAQTLTISGLTAENGFPSTCTVYIYCASDRSKQAAVFCPKTVNGTTYTYANGAVTAGTTSWGSYTYAQNNKLVLGGDYLKIDGVEITDGTVTISYAAASDGTSNKYHGTLSAVQIDFGKKDYVLSVNFSRGRHSNYATAAGIDELTGDTEYGAVPVAGRCWYNSHALGLSDQGGLIWNDGHVHANTNGISLSHSSNVWALDANVVYGNLFHSYLDDAPATVTLKGFTSQNGFQKHCWVYVYFSTDANKQFEPVRVNGVDYTWVNNVVYTGTSKWGDSSKARSNTLVLGGDYLKIGPVEIPDSGSIVLTAPDSNGSNARGGIAAVQVAFPVPTNITVSATSDEHGTVAIGQGTPGATVSVDGTFGTPVETTLTATAVAGYVFDHWEGPVGLITSGTASDAEISVRTSMPAEFRAVFLRDDVVATATWTGAGTAGDLSDTNNWLCANGAGVTIEGGLPGADTTIIIAGQTMFSFPTNATLSYRAIQFDNVQLATNVNWKGIDFAKIASGSSIDLCGNDLEMTAFNGSLIDVSCSVTDSSVQGSGGKFVLTVSEDDEFVNGVVSGNDGIALSGTLRFVKEGTGVYRSRRAGQIYTGGTHVKAGTVVCDIGTSNAANRNPFGPGDKTQTIRIETGAVLDLNNNINGSIYNYELGGKIKLCGVNQSAAWNTSFNNTWMQDIVLIDDATIEGGWIYFGSNDANDYGELNLNGKTLTVDINVGSGNDCQCYARYLSITGSDGTVRVTAASTGALQIPGADFSAANLRFEGNAFLFLGGNTVSVNDFAYARNYWGAHKNSACKVVVGGTYKAGAYRPPVELKNGATLDLSDVSGCWDATGHSGSISANNTYVSQAGAVTFTSGATIAVDLRGREFRQGKTKVVNWSAAPTDVRFVRGVTAQRDVMFKVKDDGLYVSRPVGLMILVR